MAEFLIFIRNCTAKNDVTGHYMDDVDGDGNVEYVKLQAKILDNPSLSLEQKQRSQLKLQRKYEARLQKGDIIEVRPDGAWINNNFDKDAFALIKCPKISYEAAKNFMTALESRDDFPLRFKRYSLAALGLSKGQVLVINNLKELTDKLTDKADV